MNQPIEPREAEAMPVTLMRIEGMVGGVAKDLTHLAEKVGEVRSEVIVHRGQLGAIESNVQQLQSDARAAAKAVVDADKAREDTAAALEKQTADQVAKAKAAVDSSAQKSATNWLPFARSITVIVALTGVAVLLVTWIRG